ncbi:MAG TPA: signal recognition particle-docking protein FtsY [Microthrixaceae bacterium]|nr:signal recognition particle-docking protein FtsY [Microthrixaceae bacterium]
MSTTAAVIAVAIALVLIGTVALLLVGRRRPTDELLDRTGPSVREPEVLDPGLAEPDLAASDLAEPDLVEPELVEPELVEPDFVEPDLVEPELVEAVRPTFRDRLGKARATFSGAVGSILGRSTIDEETWEDLEEAMLRADVGMGPTQDLLEAVRATVKDREITTPDGVIEAVKDEMKSRLRAPTNLRMAEQAPTIWLFVGVNGVGKTTTIGKLGRRLSLDGHSIVMAAGDTFRAAAAEQLGTWAERSGAELVRGNEGGDPSAIIFDAVAHAGASGADVVLADTAGRLHTKTNLMDELSKVRRVADKGAGTVTEVLLVLDATTGQNGLVQARQFTEAVELTGVVLTKLDGSAKGGIVFAIVSELGIPVKLVGLGETADDLVDFDADDFVDALFE